MKLLLGSAHHQNIVKFLGFCSHREEMLLVFDFARNGSLDYLLFNSKTGRANTLDWKRTYAIIIGVARGLLYLHERSHSVIIHCDIKPANIIIDENWVPKIADFGTARLFPQDQTHVNISEAAGTVGYAAPEYQNYGHISPKADIYSFGVVVLELTSGQKYWLSHAQSSNAQSLRDSANELYKEGKVSQFMDRKLIPSAVLDQVQLCVQIGVMCTQFDPELRPTMGRVYSMLSENYSSSSSTLVEEPMRDGSSSSSSTVGISGQKELGNNGSSSGTDIHLENEGLPIRRRLTRSRQIQPEDVQSYIPSISGSSCSSIGPTELANNGSSSGVDIHLENEDLSKHRRLTRSRRIQPEDVQSYIPSISGSSCSSIGPTELANNGSSSGVDIHLENEDLSKHRRLTRSRRIQPEDVQSYIPSISGSSCSSIGPTELANNGSSSGVDIHLENEDLSKHRRLTRSRRIQPEDVQSYIPSISGSSCSSIGPTELANNGSSSGVDIHLENEDLSKHRRLTRSRRIQPEDVQSYIPSISGSSCSSIGPTELANNGSSSGVDIHLENEDLSKHRRLTRSRRIQPEDVQSYIPSISGSSCSSIGPTELANNGSSSGVDIHLENEDLSKHRRLTRSRRIQPEDVQSYIPSISGSSCSSIGPTELANNGSSSGVDIHLENEDLSKHRRLTRSRRIQPEDVQSYIPSISGSSCSSIGSIDNSYKSHLHHQLQT
ncbi:receptor-like kinase LIP1 [Camellia sinensis]|uniref:receptor-like kinase LIP1 n=1 Tax=Camellia sinensis TaxID=4442 RepID=UPI00103556B5|nr:receptor-like kinase LIP1 [Camellia sinensis]